jgi:hypothetical protein
MFACLCRGGVRRQQQVCSLHPEQDKVGPCSTVCSSLPQLRQHYIQR